MICVASRLHCAEFTYDLFLLTTIMHHLLSGVIAWLQQLATQIPLEAFVLIGGVVEELIAPIPSPLVATLSGTIAAEQGYTWPMLLLVCAIGCIGKTSGATVYYVLADKLEDMFLPRFGKFVGVSHEEVEQFGRRFTGSWKDAVVLMLIRAIPMMPSTPVTVACGVVRFPLKTFLLSTYCGFFLRELFFMVLGFTGAAAASNLLEGIDSAEGLMNGLIALAVLLCIGWLYWRRRKGTLMSLIKR